MNKIILLTTLIVLTACSSTNSISIEMINKSPRGISILNVTKLGQAKAHRQAEIHCAKYSKVPRVIKSVRQEQKDGVQMHTIKFECLKPSN